MAEGSTQSAHIAYVLFLDIVGYSKGSVSAQSRLLDTLNKAVLTSPVYAAAKAANGVNAQPSGDGMALPFFGDVRAPAQCAVEVCRALAGAVPIRMGIHSGLVQRQIDIVGRENLVGEGINSAQRVMDFGDAGSILLSEQYALWLGQFDDWAPTIHHVGEGTAKHGLKLQLYSLHGEGFGRAETPAKLQTVPAPTAVPPPKASGLPLQAATEPPQPAEQQPTSAGQQPKVALLYKPTVDPDEGVIETIGDRLRSAGYEVFVDNQQRINAAWARSIEEPIRNADAVVAIISPRAMQSEMLQFEVETAYDQQLKTGKPAILPVVIGPEEGPEGNTDAILKPLRRFIWNGPEDDQRLEVELLSAIAEPLKARSEEIKLEPVGGAVHPGSPFYVRRDADGDLLGALEAGESILLVKGARQIGKTSLLGQATTYAKERAWRCAVTDFQKFNASQIASDETFYRLLAATLGRQLGFKYDFDGEWDPIFGANLNMESFLRTLLDSQDERLVWCMDEVDKLFTAPFATDFFGLVRSWHNSRSTEPDGPWNKLTIVIAYATEAHLFIQDLNQSPFNVGRRLDLEDFNLQQIIDLNGRYGGPLRTHTDCEALHNLIGGQPFLTRRALDVLATGKYNWHTMMEDATHNDGPFGDHLKRLLVGVSSLPEVSTFVKAILSDGATLREDAFYRLLAAGVIKQDRNGN
ncbi:MAG: AAA-like domain-containing protein, partial [Armatimonadota bacterium]|nr:AAA-like domain-containing protein [Armatimonadota bacterium]